MCPGEYLVTFGDTFGCQKKGLGAVGIKWVEAMGVAKHPTIVGLTLLPPIRNYLGQSNNSAEARGRILLD